MTSLEDIAVWLRGYAETNRFSDTGEMYHSGFMLLCAVDEIERLRAIVAQRAGWREYAALSIVEQAVSELKRSGDISGVTTEKMKKLCAASDTGVAATPASGDYDFDNLTDLVTRFAAALLEKLKAAEAKYGHNSGWMRDDWQTECQKHLNEHLAKGDPRDVAAYCAFLWHHGWPTVATETCPTCMGSGYSNHPDSGEVCHACKGSGGIPAQCTFDKTGESSNG